MRFRFAVPFLTAAFLFLAGCGQAVIKPPVPLDESLLPATIYVPDCPLNDEGFLGFMGAMDRAMGESACRAMLLALADKAQGMSGEVNFVTYKVDLKAPKPVEPDKTAEASVHSRYRVILSPAQSSRVYQDHISYVAANQAFSVIDTATATVVGRGSVKASPGGMPGATDAAATLLAGLRGNRCELLNALSARTAFHALHAPKCTTFALYRFHPDDEEDDEDSQKDSKQAPSTAPAKPD
ncbi:hypothetical protein ACVWWJ_003066 [Luteibacter sp. HA06]